MEFIISGSSSTDSQVTPDEIADGVFRLGGLLPLDGRVSWAPERANHIQPLSCYVVLENGHPPHLIDTGAACHRRLISDQLDALVPADRKITAFTTRNEYQCVGNLSHIHKYRGLKQLYFFGINPFAAYEDISAGMPDVRITVLDVVGNRLVDLESSGCLSILSSPIRILGTYWGYDRRTRTLFSSDWFGHTSSSVEGPGSIISDLSEDETTLEDAMEAVTMRYHWLSMSDTTPMRTWLEQLFSEIEVETIAPTFGCILKGRKVVERHFNLTMDVLRQVSR